MALEDLARRITAMEIARDVLEMLDKRKIVPVVGAAYLRFFLGRRARRHEELQGLVAGKTCDVCAIGALLLAEVTRRDDLKIGDNWSHTVSMKMSQVHERLKSIFPIWMLHNIESAFEGPDDSSVYENQPCYRDSAAIRMRKIMRNILFNGGEFDRDAWPPRKWKSSSAKIPQIGV